VFVVEGLGLLQQAVDAGWSVEAVYLSPGASVDLDVDQYPLAPNVMERVASTESPQPVLAVLSMRATELPSETTFVIVADRLADPGNAGTIIRSAEASGAQGVVLTPGSVDPFNPKVVRASAGSLFRVPVVEATLESLSGFRRLGTSSHRGDLYTDRLPRSCRCRRRQRGPRSRRQRGHRSVDHHSARRAGRKPQRRHGRDGAVIRSRSPAQHCLR